MKIAGLDLSYSSPAVVIEELDDNLNVISCTGYGFAIPKWVQPNIIEYRGPKDYPDDYSRFKFLQDHILDWCKDCEYAFVEDYALQANGRVFDLAEFEGYIKQELYRRGVTLRFYVPSTNKKFYTGYGSADKILYTVGRDIQRFLRAIPYKDSAADAPPGISSECEKRANNQTVIKRFFQNNGKIVPRGHFLRAQQM